MPAGILTVSLRWCVVRPSPLHVVQGLVMTRPGAAALAARARHREKSLLKAQLAVAFALRAGGRRASRRRAGAVTGLARFEPRNLDRRLDAFGRFFEGDLEVVAQVGPRCGAAAAAAAAEQIAEPEHVAQAAEDVAEVGEDRRIEAGAGLRRHAGMAEAIVAAALVGVRENGVRLGRFLEFLFGGVVAGVAVRMVLQRQLPIRALDLLIGGVFRHAEDFVVVAFAHALATFTMAGRSSRSPSR